MVISIINLFNGQSEKYIIVKREYESCDKLLIDVMAGKEPDLLYVGDWLDMSALYSKGLLCDLYTCHLTSKTQKSDKQNTKNPF